MKQFIIVVALNMLVLNGCTELQLLNQAPIYDQKTWKQRYQYLKHITQWNISGTFSIYQPNKMIIASYNWQQKGQNYHIRIYSSLAAYSVDIFGRPGLALWHSLKNSYTANTSEQLMRQQLGWQLPLHDLFYWIRGIPTVSRCCHSNFDVYCHLITLQQNGWCVRFSKYISVGLVDFPCVLQLSNNQIKVKIFVKNWQL